MGQINVLFMGILFSVDYESDDDGYYAMSAIINDNDWIDTLTEKGVSGLNQALAEAIEDYAIEYETEQKLSALSEEQLP